MNTFEDFASNFFEVFTSNNFYEGKTYLEYVAEPQTNDEDNIVDTKIVLPLLSALGFESGEITKNQTGGTKDSSRPDFQVKLSDDYRCFLVEDKHTAYDLSKPEPLQQLVNYAPSRGYGLGLLCNGRLLLGWDLANPTMPILVLHLDIHQIVETYQGLNLLANSQTGMEALTYEQLQSLKGLYRRFHRQNFEGIDVLIADIGKSPSEWEQSAYSQANNPNFDELLIEDLKRGIGLLEEDVLYQLDLLLQEYIDYTQAKYLPNGSDPDDVPTEPTVITDLRKQILNYLRVSGLREVDDYSWADEKLIDYAQNSIGTIRQLADKFLARLKKAEQKQESEVKRSTKIKADQLDLLSPISESKQKELGINIKPQKKITKLDPKLQQKLREYQDLVIGWHAWRARQSIKHDRAIKTQQFFQSWKELVTKTIFQDTGELKLKAEFARQTAYVYVIRLLMVRICEDKGLINRKFSDGGFKKWKEVVEPEYLDFAKGMSMDYLLEMSYRSAQSIYAHFFSNEDLFNWYHMNPNTLIRVLHILNRFNLQAIDSDIIGMVYGRYVTEGKHEQGRYFTPRKVVEYMLDSIGYTADNPDILDKKLIDLAGGSGSFLVHAARRLIDSYRSKKGEISIGSVPLIIQKVKTSLFCMDINPFACYLAETNLLIQVIDLLKQVKATGNLRECTIDRFHVYNTDSLLLPQAENIRSIFLNPVLDLELNTVSEIKTRTGEFVDGFDFVVGNPPYVRAEEPDQLTYRQLIVSQGRFETLYKKWDLFIPFIEMSRRLLKSESGKLGIITSNAYENAPYAELSRQMLCEETTLNQIDFFENVRLFSDAAINNVIFIAENRSPTSENNLMRFWHGDGENLKTFLKQDQVNQLELGEEIFRQKKVVIDLDETILLDDIVYISEGMNLASHDKKYPSEFTKDDLISDTQDELHPVRYIEGKDIGTYQINQVRYLEYGENLRAPARIRRPTFPELYSQLHIVVGKTSGITIAESGIYNSESVRVLILWFKLKGLNNRSVSQDLVEANTNISKRFSLQYLTAILNSQLGQSFLRSISSGTRDDIFSDDLRKIPIKDISLRRQQAFIKRVDNLIAWNWEIYNFRKLGCEINFKYDLHEPKIEVDFLRVLERTNPSDWSFLNAENRRFEVIGDRNEQISKVKIKDDKLIIGRNSVLLQSDSPLVLEYLKRYLPQFESRGRTWQNLLTDGKIPKTDSDIASVFAECDRLTAEIRQKIEDIRDTYEELDEMVNKLYGV
jgi:type I restriction-modification system DNA methylase subunit